MAQCGKSIRLTGSHAIRLPSKMVLLPTHSIRCGFVIFVLGGAGRARANSAIPAKVHSRRHWHDLTCILLNTVGIKVDREQDCKPSL